MTQNCSVFSPIDICRFMRRKGGLTALNITMTDAGVEGEEGEAMRVAALSVGLRFLVQVLVSVLDPAYMSL